MASCDPAPEIVMQKPSKHRARFARAVIILLGAVLAVGAWQGVGVLMYGIEGSYDH
jgi:hypothetical protein